MRVLLFLNNWNGWQVAMWLRRHNEEIVGLVLNKPEDQRFTKEILATLDLPSDRVWIGHDVRKPEVLDRIAKLQPEIGISASFAYLLKPEMIAIFPRGCINLHAAMLPYNGGWHTNVWPILDGTPAGATVHYIDSGVDSGDVIAQRETPIEPTDTGGSLHEKITRDLIELFKENWPAIREGTNSRKPQDRSKATTHRKSEIGEISRIDLDKTYKARDLIDLLRARTYLPYPSAYFIEGDKRTYIRIELLRENDFAKHYRHERKNFPPLDLNSEMTAKKLLDFLGVHSSDRFAQFRHQSAPIFARAYVVNEDEFHPEDSPKWMTES
jgi:methionyl-tRNA formyltransferase